MIWALLAILDDPDSYAVTLKDGEIHIRPLDEIPPERVRG